MIAPVARRAGERHRAGMIAVLVTGTALLGAALSRPPGDALFYPLTLGVAGVWACGALLAGPLPVFGATSPRRTVAAALGAGLLVGALFVAGGLLLRGVPVVHDHADDILGYARAGPLPLALLVALVNGAAEELFFRGALFAAAPRRPLALSTLVYGLVTLAGGNLLLALTGVVMGALLGAGRVVSGGVLAPLLTHLAWSAVVVLALPPLLS